MLYGDYIRLKQVLVNLLTNACKYTNEGKIIFNVQAQVENKICHLTISVKDTGIGISKEKMGELFKKFERFDRKKNLAIEGTGLGLAITKKIIELMNGSIQVESTYGKGSTFTVILDQKIVEKVEVKEEKKIEIIDCTGKKVLLVDDNKINLKVASRLLKAYQIEVIEVESGKEAIEKVKNQSFDLILLDDMMPELSGIETLQELKKDSNFKTPTVILTANAISGSKEKYLSVGFEDYLSKPIDQQELNRVIQKFLTK